MKINYKKEIMVIIFVGLLGIFFGAGATAGRKVVDYIWPEKEVIVKHLVITQEEEDNNEHL